jgi:hypothetical protein
MSEVDLKETLLVGDKRDMSGENQQEPLYLFDAKFASRFRVPVFPSTNPLLKMVGYDWLLRWRWGEREIG